MGIVRAKIKGSKELAAAADRQKARFRPRVRPSNCHERGHEMAKVGDKVPSATLRMMTPEGPKPISTEELFAPGRKVVAFALPGAFTPT
jgi:Peroxiredoxin